jgi:glycosyltransferase involved in cell wall biosynthesis
LNVQPTPIRVFVQLAYGFGGRSWEQRWHQGAIIGLNERLPYGYYLAQADGCDVIYSDDHAENLLQRLCRFGVRAILGFDALHAWRNRKEMLKADVVWTHTESQHLAVCLILLLYNRRRSPKLIAQSVWLFDRWPRLFLIRRWLYSALLSRADLLTVLSPDNLAVARERFPEKRSELVLFGIRTDLRRPLRRQHVSRPVRVLSIGNDRHRDWDTLIAAVDGWNECEVRIASQSLNALKLSSSRNITRVIPKTNDELEQLYDWADLVVVPLRPNLHASGITVMQEAALFGVPIIVTDTGGLRAYFGNSQVRYIPTGNAQALKQAIADLASDAQLRKNLAEAAQAHMGEGGLSSRAYARTHAELSKSLVTSANDEIVQLEDSGSVAVGSPTP